MVERVGRKLLQTIGLLFSLGGVIMIIIWGPPQGEFDPRVDVILFDNPRLGFALQLLAAWAPHRASKSMPIEIRAKQKTK